MMDLSTAQQQLLHHHYQQQQQQQQQQQEMMTGSHSDSQSLDSIITSSKPHKAEAAQPQDKKPRPPDNEAQKCPRCESTNTKFCYYNNYSLTQPRYFCKSCRRYWTKGGTLRNVPVGGGCRKSSSSSSIKRPSSPSPCFSSSMFKRAHNHDAGLMGVDPLLHHQLQLSSYGFEDCNINNANNNNPHGVSINIAYNNINGGLFQNLCYGGGNSSSVSGISQDQMNNNIMEAATTTTTTTTKQEAGVVSGNERAMWGFPWQLSYGNGDIGSGGHVVEPPISIRGPWNGLMPNSLNSGWHALLNTTTPPPLM